MSRGINSNLRKHACITNSSILLVIALLLTNMSIGCGSAMPGNASAPTYRYDVVAVFPHDPDAFTQGLEFHDGKLLESTGEEGRSSLRSIELETGKVLKKVEIPPPYFAEGVSLLRGRIYQLTWQHQLGFIYDSSTFQRVGDFAYEGQGWGLTNDGQSLIMSDGSNRLRFLDPDTFQVEKTIAVLDGKIPVRQLNELEYVNGEIYANIWHDQRIAIINPETGKVNSWLDLTGLLAPGELTDPEAVLNGIAYDSGARRLFVTGKLWPKVFEIRTR
jgi:glutamine cyclotransferase